MPTITSISPKVVSLAGGDKVTLTGIFPISSSFQVTVDGIVAYSGKAGQKNTATSEDGTALSFVTPPIPVASVGDLTVEVTETPGATTDQILLTVVERSFGSATFEMRRMFPPWLAVGPRSLDAEEQ